MTHSRRVVLYIAASLDGYIAAPGDDLSFLNAVQRENEDYGYAAFMSTVDTVILGRRTYDWVMSQVPEFPHANTETYVVTRSPRPQVGKTTFYTGSLRELIERLRSQHGQTIFIDGGAQLVHSLLQQDLIDEIIVSVIPVLLGDGVRLFHSGIPQRKLELLRSHSYASGLVQLHYRVVH